MRRTARMNILQRLKRWLAGGWEMYGDKLERRRAADGGWQYRCCADALVGVDGQCPVCRYRHGYLPGANTPGGQGYE